MPLSVILRTDAYGRMALARPAAGSAEFTDAKKAEAEASRMRFRDEANSYCTYTGLFKDAGEATRFVQLVNKGMRVDRAYRALRAG
jgi:hypothetical protein